MFSSRLVLSTCGIVLTSYRFSDGEEAQGTLYHCKPFLQVDFSRQGSCSKFCNSFHQHSTSSKLKITLQDILSQLHPRYSFNKFSLLTRRKINVCCIIICSVVVVMQVSETQIRHRRRSRVQTCQFISLTRIYVCSLILVMSDVATTFIFGGEVWESGKVLMGKSHETALTL